MNRQTIQRRVERHGVGLRGGSPCRATLHPAAPGVGRTLNGAPVTIDAVVSVARTTQLMTPTGPVAMVEHLLAALCGLGVHDVKIEVVGGEVPALDGSAAPWIEALVPHAHGGLVEPLRLTAPVEVHHGDAWIRAEPADTLSFDVRVDFAAFGRQRFVGADIADFAAARTFGLLADRDRLEAAGLIGGVSLENTVVFDASGAPLNPGGLRWPDEPVRHKCLDLLGDLALLNRPLHAHVIASGAGHALHHALVRALRSQAPCLP